MLQSSWKEEWLPFKSLNYRSIRLRFSFASRDMRIVKKKSKWDISWCYCLWSFVWFLDIVLIKYLSKTWTEDTHIVLHLYDIVKMCICQEKLNSSI